MLDRFEVVRAERLKLLFAPGKCAILAVMEAEGRKTGIDVVGEVPWGTHFCQFYRTNEDLIDILAPYFQAGLENNEFCM